MITVSVRVWLPDRPGALGQVASRIGAVRGEIVGIDILERGAGRVIDEIVVLLPRSLHLDLLAKEIAQVDGVDVEEVRVVPELVVDPGTVAVELAARLSTVPADEVLEVLVTECTGLVRAAWSAVVSLPDQDVVVQAGEPDHDPAWLVAFCVGASGSTASDETSAELMWARVSDDLLVVVGRTGATFHQRERRKLTALAAVAGSRLA